MDLYNVSDEEFRKTLRHKGMSTIGTRAELISRLNGPPLEKLDPEEAMQSRSSPIERKVADLTQWTSVELIEELQRRALPVEGNDPNWKLYSIDKKRSDWIARLNGKPSTRCFNVKPSTHRFNVKPSTRCFNVKPSTHCFNVKPDNQRKNNVFQFRKLDPSPTKSKVETTIDLNWNFPLVSKILTHSKDPKLLKPKLFRWLRGTKEDLPRSLKLVQMNNYNLNTTDSRGVTPLFISSLNNDYYSTMILLILGANPNLQINPEKEKLTALMVVGLNGNFELAKLLLQYGADPNIKDLNGRKAFNYAFDQKKKYHDIFHEKYQKVINLLI